MFMSRYPRQDSESAKQLGRRAGDAFAKSVGNFVGSLANAFSYGLASKSEAKRSSKKAIYRVAKKIKPSI